jgi:hypothetical protein
MAKKQEEFGQKTWEFQELRRRGIPLAGETRTIQEMRQQIEAKSMAVRVEINLDEATLARRMAAAMKEVFPDIEKLIKETVRIRTEEMRRGFEVLHAAR